MSISPCFLRHPCPDRSPTCHGTCQAFKEWDANHRAKREKRNAKKSQENGVTDYIVKQKLKMKKRRNKR